MNHTDNTLLLWYRQPAGNWEEALPLGNGRIGAMVFGGVSQERIALNEDTLWSGFPIRRNSRDHSMDYQKARQLALDGRYAESEELIEQCLLGPFTQSYLPLGDLLFSFDGLDNASEYRRSLSLSRALCRTEFVSGGVYHTREAFVSAPANALYLRFSANRSGKVSFAMSFGCKLRHAVRIENKALILEGICPSNVVPSYIECEDPVTYSDDAARKGMRFAARATVEAEGGEIVCGDGVIRVRDADSAVIRFAARTSFSGFDRHPYLEGTDESALCARDAFAAAGIPYAEARESHINDYSSLFDRVSLELDGGQYSGLPTDERLTRAFSDDCGLAALLFHYGRYLLIASSRPGTQPANLQGIWNEHLRAAWSCNYTININTQMNYWPAELCGLAELKEPLYNLISELLATGADAARSVYGARGAVSHHNTDIWRLSTPVGDGHKGFAGCAFFPMSLGWLCAHMYEHYLYTGDKAFLRERALPALREVSRFYLDIMTHDSSGRLIITPATSPENVFIYRGETVKVSRETTINGAIARESLTNYLSALDALSLDEPMKAEAADALARLPRCRTGSSGQILEWEEEYEEPEPHHRHVSHLYGLYPGREITAEGTPELAAACRRSLALRGDGGTGWSLAWKINLYARLGDGDKALQLIRRQLKPVKPGEDMNLTDGGTYPNLMDAHPPFQIDGNFGVCAGIADMLLQSGEGWIRLLPALPSAWRSGSVRGLRAFGNVEAGIAFNDGLLANAEIRRPAGTALTVKYKERILRIPEDAPEAVVISGSLQFA